MNDTATPIYLDHNATTPLLPEVVAAMLPYLEREFGNPSSAHPYGQRARRAVDAARAEVAALLGAQPDEILFTSGGTEANNLAIVGLTRALAADRRAIVTSSIEHPATREPCRALEAGGHPVTWLPVDPEGRVEVDAAGAAISAQTALVSVMHANNETGALQPIGEIAEIAHARGALVHSDAAQSAGKIPLEALGADLVSIAGHKLGAPKGVGALYVRRGTPLRPVLLGAGHERGLRPGTENVASIVGLGVAAREARRRLEAHATRMLELTRALHRALAAAVPGLALAGHETMRLPNTLNLLFPGVRGSALLERAPEIAASTGSACHAGEESASSVLLAMGIEPERALGAVRLSLGVTTSKEDVERAAAALVRAFRELGR
jgi:cysteine desulfurase